MLQQFQSSAFVWAFVMITERYGLLRSIRDTCEPQSFSLLANFSKHQQADLPELKINDDCIPDQIGQSQETGLPSNFTRDSNRRKQGSWLSVACPIGESEVNTARGLLDRRGNAALLVFNRAPLAQRDGHLETVERGSVDLARLAKVFVGVVEPIRAVVVDMAVATLRTS